MNCTALISSFMNICFGLVEFYHTRFKLERFTFLRLFRNMYLHFVVWLVGTWGIVNSSLQKWQSTMVLYQLGKACWVPSLDLTALICKGQGQALKSCCLMPLIKSQSN